LAPRLRTKSKTDARSPNEDREAASFAELASVQHPAAPSRLILAGLVALALLALGEQAPGAFPVHVSLLANSATGEVQVSVDGETHSVPSSLSGRWQQLVLDQPRPVDREYQVDGSDTTSTNDRNPLSIAALLNTPLYRLDAFLRDESSYSRWERLAVTDLATGQAVSPDGPLPAEFRVDVDLRRPEAPARLWLVDASGEEREGLELDRDKRNARWVVDRGQGIQALPRWFFPEQPAPFAAELLQLLGRSAAAGFALLLVALGLRAAAGFAQRWAHTSWRTRSVLTGENGFHACAADGSTAIPSQEVGSVETRDVGDLLAERVPDLALAVWLLAAALVATEQYHQLPHILDAVSYTFQAALFASGQLSLPEPPLISAFKGPFEVVWQGRIFSQYPPGAAAFYALGRLVGLEWLVGPVACAVLIGATSWTARSLYGAACGLAALGLGVISPFILFQAGSYLSHPIAGGLAAGAIAAFVAGERYRSDRWYAVCGALLGATFLVREVAAVLVALPLGVRLLACRRWSPIGTVVALGVPFMLVYLLYNLQQTGSPLLLPRMLFDPSDHFGFGDGVGFHTRHTLAAGLANTDELLTLLQFDLFGWPPLFAFGLISLPFLLGRARAWDFVALGGFLTFVVAYVGYFYHGIALGPRYYFEAMPWLLLLGARGVQVLAQVASSRVAAVVLVAALTLNTVFFYTPAELDRRTDLSGIVGQSTLDLSFVRTSLLGPQLAGVPENSLVVTDDWWLFNAGLSALNCPRLPNCDVLFALATNTEEVDRLRLQYPGRTVLRAVDTNGRVTVLPS
jgi:hypothetical protein